MSSPRRSRRRRAERRTQRAQVLIGNADAIRRMAEAFICPDCQSEHGRTYKDAAGVIHHEVHHDPGCPYLNGVTA